MSDSKSNETNPSTTSKSPSHIVYQIRGKAGEKRFFNRVGAAWPTKNGNGFNIQLDAVPLDGKLTLCPASEAKE